MSYRIVFLDRATVPDHINLRSPVLPKKRSHDWVNYSLTQTDDIVERAIGADVIVTNKVIISEDIIAQLPQLQHIALIATGYNNIDIEACRSRKIGVSNTRGYANISVPEHTIALMFSLSRHILTYDYSVRDGLWQQSPFFHGYQTPTQDLASSQLGIIGSGDLGTGTAKLAKALGMHVVFSDRKGEKPSGRKGYLPFDQVIEESDIISLHCPLTQATQNLIALEEMQRMKTSALLINTARGGLINEIDLVTAINEQWIAGVGLDVVEHEPIHGDSPLLSIINKPNVIITPHIAWTSDQAMQIQAEQLIGNIEAFASRKKVNRVV